MDGDSDIYKGKPPAHTNDEDAFPGPPAKKANHTCESLHLNIAAAQEGKTWLLLPEGFRSTEFARTYPLPMRRAELQKLVFIPLPEGRTDHGAIYLRRAIEAFMKKSKRDRQSLHITTARREQEILAIKTSMRMKANEFKREAAKAVESVRLEADKAIASLNDLFALGRDGLGKIMQAHLAGSEWQGEKVSTDQFMGCFRMVSQAVKGLGLPSEQRAKAHAAIMDEVSAALKNTREAIAIAPGSEETEQ